MSSIAKCETKGNQQGGLNKDCRYYYLHVADVKT